MGLANIQSFANVDDYWFNHYQDHVDIVQVVNRLIPGLNMWVYPMFPWSDSNKGQLLEQHFLSHTDLNTILGIDNSDLGDVDFGDEEKRGEWIYQNYQMHLQAHTILGF